MGTRLGMHEIFHDTEFRIQRKALTIAGAKFHVYDPHGRLLLYSKQKAFSFELDIRVYGDESEQEERLRIHAPAILELSAEFGVSDPVEESKVGTLRRWVGKATFRDRWEILDPHDQVIATLEQRSLLRAILGDLLKGLVPHVWQLEIGGVPIAFYRRRFSPFRFRIDLKLEAGAGDIVDPRLMVAAGILLAAIQATPHP